MRLANMSACAKLKEKMEAKNPTYFLIESFLVSLLRLRFLNQTNKQPRCNGKLYNGNVLSSIIVLSNIILTTKVFPAKETPTLLIISALITVDS